MPREPSSVIRKTDDKARRLARLLVRSARYGSLAVLDAASGAPLASRVATATDIDGTPLILISSLSRHTAALAADRRCSLLLGEPARGNPLAHPRVSLSCHARFLSAEDPELERAKRRFLSRHPQAAVYAEFTDFTFVSLGLQSAALNGGFGSAYELLPDDVLTISAANSRLCAVEPKALEHLNTQHADAVSFLARHYGNAARGKWTATGIDADGLDLSSGDHVVRIFFPARLAQASDLRKAIAEMTAQAREQGDDA